MNIKLKYLLITFFSLLTFNTIVNLFAHEKRKTDYTKVAEDNIDVQEIESVKKYAHTIITDIENREYWKFTNQNSKNDIVDKIDYAWKNLFQKRIKSKFGRYIDLHFESLHKSKTQNPFLNTIYRFKGEFKSKKDVEIRLYLTNKKEIVDLRVMSWKKELFN